MAKKDPTESPAKSRPPPLPPAKGAGKSIAKSSKSIAKSAKSIARPAKTIGKSGKSIAKQLHDQGTVGNAVDDGPTDRTPRRPTASKPDLPQPPSPAEEKALIEALVQAVRVQAGRFNDRDEIGRGGVGAVSTLVDSVLQRRTAMKKILDSVRELPVMVRSFIREAQITAQLDHPNLVPVHDIGVDDDGRVFFTMKLVEGKTLSQLIESYKEDNHHIDQAYELLVEMLEVLLKVSDALAFAHSRGVIHCDIKAQNIMVGDYGQAYLMDWGFAQLLPPPVIKEGEDDKKGPRRVEDPLPKLPEASTSGYVFGTPGYMSPEQAQGLTDKLDERTDVFSLGALLYQILSGDVPYRARSPGETVLLAQKCKYPPLEAESVGLYSLRPRELVRISARAMAKAPEDRYQSVEAFKADIVHYLRGGSHFPTRSFETGAHIIREGEDPDAAFIIASGQCEVYKTVAGKKVVLQVLTAGEVFGEMALLTASARNASVVALTDVKLMLITRDVLEHEMTSMKPWMGALVRALASRFRDVQEQSVQRGNEPTFHDDLQEGKRPWWKFW